MSAVETERVLVVPASLLNELGYFQGFQADTETYLAELLKSEHASYRPRAEMEEDPSFKQLIPYVVFQHTDQSETRLFAYTRGSGQGEKRLRRKRSIGVGGHICVDDVAQGQSPYEEGMRRELDEEVAIGSPYTAKCVGLINDDETEVGRVHLGVVHVFDLQEPRVHSREDDLAESGFVPVSEIMNELESFETWSQICLRSLYG
jgi:predicted NUDIX family phosphoesterase